MTKIITSEDCGNSPKNIFLEKLTIALVQGDAHFILESVTDDICWTIIGQETIHGKDGFAQALKRSAKNKAEELIIHHVATHGKAGAVNGTVKLKNVKIKGFCNMYEFNGVKAAAVKEITSYAIETA